MDPVMIDLEGFEGIYSITSDGRIIVNRDGSEKRIFTRKGREVAMVELTRGQEKYVRSVARLVFQHFCSRYYDPTEQICHKDGDPMNNDISNLEQYGTKLPKHRRRAWPIGTRVRIVETGEIFNTVFDAAVSIGGHPSNIYACLYGTRSTHKGYHFEKYNEPRIVYNDRKFD